MWITQVTLQRIGVRLAMSIRAPSHDYAVRGSLLLMEALFIDGTGQSELDAALSPGADSRGLQHLATLSDAILQMLRNRCALQTGKLRVAQVRSVNKCSKTERSHF